MMLGNVGRCIQVMKYTFDLMLNELRTYLSMPYFLMIVLRWKIDLEHR